MQSMGVARIVEKERMVIEMPPKGKGDLARQKQEEEVARYLQNKLPALPMILARQIIEVIMARYDLFDCEDLKQE